MHLLDLFSGIGGFHVALDLVGIPIDAEYHSDINVFSNKVYAKNFPDSIQLGDIRGIDGKALRERHPEPWICTLGFPCQDLSQAGSGKGLKGERSGLWYEALRVIEELQPELVFIENVAILLRRGLNEVLRGLDAAGYDAEWKTLSAQEVGAIHQRKRLWIIARHSDRDAGREYHELPAERRDLGEGTKRNGQSHGVMSWTEWQAIKAERAILGEPLVFRADDGICRRMDWIDRIKACGNAIVPECAARILEDYLARNAPIGSRTSPASQEAAGQNPLRHQAPESQEGTLEQAASL